MSLVYSNVQIPPASAQTHVLVIGVGDYPNIQGGQAFNPNVPLTAGLKQLTSSVLSAEWFAKWMIGDLDNPAAPLGSVEIALSPATFNDAQGGSHNVDTADFAGIKKAFNAWYGRCDLSKDNVAVFYFCGHGLQDVGTILLPADFGASPMNLGDEMIDFTTTYRSMAECAAKTQLYLLDACREQPIELLRGTVTPRPLKTSTTNRFPVRDAYILFSAPMGQKAHAPANAVSYFTAALTRCLGKLGARNRSGSWWDVSTSSLTDAVVRLMQRLVATGVAPEPCTRSGESGFETPIHRIAHPVDVIAEIDCDPIVALPHAELFVLLKGTTVDHREREKDPWLCEIAAGIYDLEARFPGGQYSVRTMTQVIVYPPYFHESIRV